MLVAQAEALPDLNPELPAGYSTYNLLTALDFNAHTLSRYTESGGSAPQSAGAAGTRRKDSAMETYRLKNIAIVLLLLLNSSLLLLVGYQQLQERRTEQETAQRLQQTLQTFGVKVKITDISQGPSVTRYELQPEQGVKVSKIVGLSDDSSRSGTKYVLLPVLPDQGLLQTDFLRILLPRFRACALRLPAGVCCSRRPTSWRPSCSTTGS